MTRSLDLVELIKKTFSGVKLETGISWQEAAVLDNHGSLEERKIAREKDEQNDWTQIPSSLIGDLKYQDVLPFLDSAGLKFYLPACMIYTIKNYKTTDSLITHSIIYSLTREETAIELKNNLSPSQKDCVIKFLLLCLEIGDDYFDLHKVEKRLQQYWS